MYSKRLNLAILLSLSLFTAPVMGQQPGKPASKPQTSPKPKPQPSKPVPQPRPGKPGDIMPPTQPGQPGQPGQPMPPGMAGSGAKPGKLLDSVALSKKQTFITFEEASRTPAEVYKLKVSNAERFPDDLGNFVNLQVLEITGRTGNPAPNDLPPNFSNLTNLTDLKINNMGLRMLSPEFVKHVNLRKLDLNNNPLAMLPEGIAQLHELSELRIGDANVVNLPMDMSAMGNLKVLETSAQNLPPLPVLTTLIYINRGPVLPESIGRLNNLQRFKVISSMPMEFGQVVSVISMMHNLRSLDMAGANVAFQDLSQLTMLDKLEFMRFGRLNGPPAPVNGFRGMKSLAFLSSACNEKECEGFFHGLSEIPAKENLTMDWHKEGTEYYKKFKNVTIVFNNIREAEGSIASMAALTNLTGILLGQDMRSIPAGISNLKTLNNVDASNAMNFDYNQLISVLTKNPNIHKVVVTEEGLGAIAMRANELKGIQVIVVKRGVNMGPPGMPSPTGVGGPMGNISDLQKKLPTTKIVFED